MDDDSRDRPLLALLMRLTAVVGLATMSALVKLASARGIHLAEIVFWRQAITLPLILGWLGATGGLARLATKRPRMHAVRAGYGMVGMMLTFGAVILLPLAEATVLNFTAPIWAVILTSLLLKEHVGIWRWSAVALGFAGVLIIAQPGGAHFPLYGALVALGAAFMVALISIQIRGLNRTEEPVTIVFWFATGGTLVALPFLPFFFAPTHSLTDWLLLLGIGLAGAWGQLLLTASLRFGAVASVIVMDYSALIWATLYGWLLFDMFPPSATLFGAPLVVVSGLVIAWREHVRMTGRTTTVGHDGT